MIQFVLTQCGEPDLVELRASSIGSDTAAKPPLVVHHDHLHATLLCLLRASQASVSRAALHA